jgi:hypothetical protein
MLVPSGQGALDAMSAEEDREPLSSVLLPASRPDVHKGADLSLGLELIQGHIDHRPALAEYEGLSH